jgi:hypothetical protein
VVGPVRTRFAYTFASKRPARVHGKAGLVAHVKVGSGLSKTFTVAPSRSFTGAKTTVPGTLPLKKIMSYVTSASKALGSDTGVSGVTVVLTPKIHASGSVGGHALKTTYSPGLPFALSGDTLTISSGSSSPDASSGSSPPAAHALKPSAKGAVRYPATEPSTVSLLVVHPSTTVAMGVGFGVALACLLLGLWLGRPLLGAEEGAGEPERIRALYGGQLVPIRSLSLPDGPIADVTSIAALAELAKKYESMIMHLADETGDSYLVWDQGMTYRYCPAATRPPAGPSGRNGHDDSRAARLTTAS